jgi:hypothetical protein
MAVVLACRVVGMAALRVGASAMGNCDSRRQGNHGGDQGGRKLLHVQTPFRLALMCDLGHATEYGKRPALSKDILIGRSDSRTKQRERR